MYEFEDYVNESEERYRDYEHLRRGQCYSNVLLEHNADLFTLATRRGADPFYVDDNLPIFLTIVEENWGYNE